MTQRNHPTGSVEVEVEVEVAAAESDDRRARNGEMSAGDVPEAVKQFVTCLYGHVRDKNGAFPGETTRRRDAEARFLFFGFFTRAAKPVASGRRSEASARA